MSEPAETTAQALLAMHRAAVERVGPYNLQVAALLGLATALVREYDRLTAENERLQQVIDRLEGY